MLRVVAMSNIWLRAGTTSIVAEGDSAFRHAASDCLQISFCNPVARSSSSFVLAGSCNVRNTAIRILILIFDLGQPRIPLGAGRMGTGPSRCFDEVTMVPRHYFPARRGYFGFFTS